VRVSQRGVALIKMFEGLELEAYRDIAGVWTIGYGHAGADVRPGMRITEREAEELLRRDLKPREDAVGRLAAVSLNQNEFDALVSFVYNVGAAAFRRSTARKRLNRNDRLGAAEALAWWNRARIGGNLREVFGLTRRRAAERALFLTPVGPPLARELKNFVENSRARPVETPPRRTNVAQSRTVQGASVAGGAGVAASALNGDEAAGGAAAGVVAPIDADAATPPTPSLKGVADANITVHESGEIVGGESEISKETLFESAAGAPTVSKDDVEAPVQFALTLLLVLAVAFVIYARFDDWRHFRR